MIASISKHGIIRVGLIMLAGVALSVGAFIVVHNWDRQRLVEDFEQAAEMRYTFLKREVESDIQALVVLKTFYVRSGKVTRADFHAFSKPLLMMRPSIQALEWIPRISYSQREKYEQAAQREGFPNFQITERVAQGKMARTDHREKYYPVYFVEPYEGNEVALGFDLASNPARKEALERSRDTGKEVATSRITLVQEKTTQFGFLVVSPIYERGAPDNSVLKRREKLLGFVLGVFRISDIVEKAFSYLKPEGINVYLYDRSAPEKERLLFSHSSGMLTTDLPMNYERAERGRILEYSKTLDIAGRQWGILCVPTTDFIAKRKSLQSWGVLSGGLFSTALLTGFLLINFRRSEELSIANEQLVHKITERKQAEEALRRSEAKFRALVFNSHDGIVFCNASGVITYRSPSYIRINGYTDDERVGHSGFETVHPDDLDAVRQTWTQVLQHPEMCAKAEYRIRHKNGTWRWIESTVQNLLDNPDVQEIVVTSNDITERKEAEKAVVLAKEEWERTFNASSDPIMILGTDCRIKRLNKAMAEMIGSSVDDAVGKLCYEEVHKKTEHVPACPHATLFEDQKPHTEEFYEPFLDKYLLVTASPLFDSDGKLYGSVHYAKDITDRKLAEIALKRSESMLQTIIDTEPECVKLLDKEGRVIMMNQAGLDMIEADSLEQVKGQSVFPLLVSEHRQPFMELTQRVFKGESGTLEFEVVGLKGGHVWMETHAVPFRNEKEVIALLGVTRNVTDRRHAEEELRESQERFRSLSEASIEGLMVHDHGVILDANLAFARLFGYEQPEELIGKDGPEFMLTPESRARVRQRIKRKEKGLLEVTGVRKDGTTFAMETESRPMKYRGRDARIVSCRNITDLKRAQEALRQSEEMLRSTLNNVDEGFLVIDRDLRIQLANETYSKWVGMLIYDIIGSKCYEITHKVFKPCYEAGEACAVRDSLETGIPQRMVHDHTDKDGNKTYIEIKTFPIKDSSGNVISVIETLSDITGKYLLEEERVKTQKLEAIGTLAGGIAHDFNNLLQGIFGYISLAKMRLDQKEKSLTVLEQAEKALHQAVNLTMQLLTFSKGGKPVKKLIALQPVIENAARLALSGSGSDCHITMDRGLWQAEVDEGQISQVIQNIVLNASDAMPSGGIVEISATNVEIAKGDSPFLPEGGRFIKIAIQDSGVGIPERYLSRIFEPYFTTKQKGSGLGLASAYSIIRNHAGAIDVASETTQGSTFIIYLPASEDKAAKKFRISAPVAVRKGNILVMDDDEMVRELARELIATLGHKVEVAKDGADAIEKYRQAKQSGRDFDIVILDLTVRRGIGGEEALQKLREIDPEVKAVVSSGYADGPVVSDYRSYGFVGSLNKPYTIDALNDSLNILLVK